jgi:hypothetical protein
MLNPILTSAAIALALSATPTMAQGYGGCTRGLVPGFVPKCSGSRREPRSRLPND